MNLEQRIDAFSSLGNFIKAALVANDHELAQGLQQAIQHSQHSNNWFTPENVRFALENWAKLLNKEKLTTWLSNYTLKESSPKTIGLIMAGNIPLVGFHDMLSVLITGHYVKIKTSSKDQLVLTVIISFLKEYDPYFKKAISIVQGKLEDYDAVIATGSNNTARYFEYYFGHKPNIIRKNRTSVAVITGDESEEELLLLGNDIFRYFGLGCRNVSKLYVPIDYDLNNIFGAIYPWKHLIEDKKYANNYDYNKAVYLMSEFDFLDNGFAMLKEDSGMHSPIASIFYEYYDSKETISTLINDTLAEQIQCVVSKNFTSNEIPFGSTQQPQLEDYADGVDTVDFLLKI